MTDTATMDPQRESSLTTPQPLSEVVTLVASADSRNVCTPSYTFGASFAPTQVIVSAISDDEILWGASTFSQAQTVIARGILRDGRHPLPEPPLSLD